MLTLSNNIKQKIESKIRHSYIENNIQKPLIDLDKITILNVMYNDLNISTKKKEHYITTIMLVQIALDTHELVPNSNTSSMVETKKQLYVLAGDYYSGLYYLLLSEIDDIPMIQTLAKAIKNINEQKMILFNKDIRTQEQLFKTVDKIESLLFEYVGYFIGSSETELTIIKELLFINRLLRELEYIHKRKFSYIKNYIENDVFDVTSQSVISIIENEIDKRKIQLEQLLVKAPYHIVQLKNLIFDKITLKVAEEG